jgi:hypothetical protein
MTTNRTHRIAADATPGFGYKIEADTELRGGMLIMETAEGYEPISPVSSISEAREMAYSTRRAGSFRVWAPGLNGKYATVATFKAA